MKFTFGGQAFIADASGALYWPARRSLIVADLHLEKGSSFGTRGQFLPPYDSVETLARLAALVARYQPLRLITLGDNVHDAGGWARLSSAAQAQLFGLALDTNLIFLYGNHDRLQPPPVGQAWPTLTEDDLHMTHEPALGDLPTLAGHLHPAISLATSAGRRRARCFMVGHRLLILPAFGAFTGGLDVMAEPFAVFHAQTAQLLVCGAGQNIHPLPFDGYKARKVRVE